MCQVFPFWTTYPWHMPEKGKKNIPFYFPELLTVPTSLVCPLPAPCHCQLQISWPVPCSGESLSLGQPRLSESRGTSSRNLGWALQDTEQEMLLQPPARAPTPAKGVPFGFQISPALHTCQSQAWMCQLSPELLTRSKSRQWQSPSQTSCQKSPAGQGMSPGESALPSHSPLCRRREQTGEQTAWETSGLDWAGLVKSASPGLAKELLWKAKRHIYLKQIPAREISNFALQMHKLIAHKRFTLAGGTYTNEVLSLPTPSPQRSPSKALEAATKSWDCAASPVKEKQILLAP